MFEDDTYCPNPNSEFLSMTESAIAGYETYQEVIIFQLFFLPFFLQSSLSIICEHFAEILGAERVQIVGVGEAVQ